MRCEAGTDLLRVVGDFAKRPDFWGEAAEPALLVGAEFLSETCIRGHPCSVSVRIHPVALVLLAVTLSLIAQLALDSASMYALTSSIVISSGGQRVATGQSFLSMLAYKVTVPSSAPTVAGSHDPLSFPGWLLLRGNHPECQPLPGWVTVLISATSFPEICLILNIITMSSGLSVTAGSTGYPHALERIVACVTL